MRGFVIGCNTLILLGLYGFSAKHRKIRLMQYVAPREYVLWGKMTALRCMNAPVLCKFRRAEKPGLSALNILCRDVIASGCDIARNLQ